VRLDGGFASPEVLDFLDCEPKVRASQTPGQTEHVYGECQYATRKTWPWKRRIIYKAEVVRAANKEPKDNPRFVVTNLK
jgi:hypothetical protein